MRPPVELLAATLVAISSLAAQDPHSSVTVTVAGTRSHANDLAVAALTLRSYPITSATDQLIITGEKQLRFGDFPMAIHAMIMAVGADSARVVLTGFMPAFAMQPPYPLTKPVTTRFKHQYAQLEQVAADIGAAATGGEGPASPSRVQAVGAPPKTGAAPGSPPSSPSDSSARPASTSSPPQ